MKVSESCLSPKSFYLRTGRICGVASEMLLPEPGKEWKSTLFLHIDLEVKRFDAYASTMDDAVTLAFEKLASSGVLSPDECKEIALDLFEEVDVTVDVMAAI